MSLIIKNKIAQLKKGYPTVSDKYNVQGGINEGPAVLHFGDLIAYGTTTGHYKKLAATDTVDKLAGILLATNVKLANKYPGDSNASVETLVAEPFNLLVRGFVAVAIKNAAYETALATYKTTMADPAATPAAKAQAKADLDTAKANALATIHEGAQVYLDTTDATLVAAAGTAIPGVYFMGVAEFAGEELLAEINYRM